MTATRDEANERVDRQKRYRQVLEILAEGDATAQEVATRMHSKGYTPTADRNNAAPRLTELEKVGVVQIVGKKIDSISGRKVAVYRKIIA